MSHPCCREAADIVSPGFVSAGTWSKRQAGSLATSRGLGEFVLGISFPVQNDAAVLASRSTLLYGMTQE